MSTRTADYRDAVEHLPDGVTLVIHDFRLDDYEHLLDVSVANSKLTCKHL